MDGVYACACARACVTVRSVSLCRCVPEYWISLNFILCISACMLDCEPASEVTPEPGPPPLDERIDPPLSDRLCTIPPVHFQEIIGWKCLVRTVLMRIDPLEPRRVNHCRQLREVLSGEPGSDDVELKPQFTSEQISQKRSKILQNHSKS
jgi:hypothetical protein